MMASDVASSVGEQVFNNDAKRQSIADGSGSFMNIMKLRKRGDSFNNIDLSSVSGCTTTKEFPTRRVSVSTDRSSTNALLLRRRSTLKGMAQSITGLLRLRRQTLPRIETVKPKVKCENTYKMSPDFGDHIAMSKIEEIAEEILREELGSKEYSCYFAGDLACSISAKIKNKVKEMNFPRYRVVCQVVITQVKDQGLEAASRSLWDASSDNYTTVTYQNDDIAAIAMIYGVYYE